MTFTDGYRVERVYFERLKSLITILKSLKDGVQDETVRTLIENAIDSDGAILLLYRNLGEAWAELADQVQKTRKMLQDLDEKTEKYHDELNERIDEVNNYLMALIRALEARMDAVEADLAQMGRLFTYDLNRVNDEYTLTESGQPVTWAGTVEKVQHVRPHFVTVRGSLDGEVTYLMPREYDTAQASGIFEWYSVGFVGNEIHEVTVTLLPDDSVNVAIHTTDFASILQRISALETRMTAAEGDIDNLETRMTTAEGDIDTLEQTAENHNDRITDLEECCDDMTENVIPGLQTAIAGKQDALTAGTGIDITGNVISADTDVLQEKLVAGSGITIDTNTNEISATGTTYTSGENIEISNNIINAVVSKMPFTSSETEVNADAIRSSMNLAVTAVTAFSSETDKIKAIRCVTSKTYPATPLTAVGGYSFDISANEVAPPTQITDVNYLYLTITFRVTVSYGTTSITNSYRHNLIIAYNAVGSTLNYLHVLNNDARVDIPLNYLHLQLARTLNDYDFVIDASTDQNITVTVFKSLMQNVITRLIPTLKRYEK